MQGFAPACESSARISSLRSSHFSFFSFPGLQQFFGLLFCVCHAELDLCSSAQRRFEIAKMFRRSKVSLCAKENFTVQDIRRFLVRRRTGGRKIHPFNFGKVFDPRQLARHSQTGKSARRKAPCWMDLLERRYCQKVCVCVCVFSCVCVCVCHTASHANARKETRTTNQHKRKSKTLAHTHTHTAHR